MKRYYNGQVNKNMKLPIDVCSCAAKGGHLEILKWARSNGCP